MKGLSDIITQIYMLAVTDPKTEHFANGKKSENNQHDLFERFSIPLWNATGKNDEVLNRCIRLFQHLCEYYKPSEELKFSPDVLRQFTDWSTNTVRNWMIGKTASMHLDNLYYASVYFTFGLLFHVQDSEPYFRYFTNELQLGVNPVLLHANAVEKQLEEDVVLQATYLMLAKFGSNDQKKLRVDQLESFRRYLKSNFTLMAAAQAAEEKWLQDVIEFSPRSLTITNRVAMQDCYVYPEFKSFRNDKLLDFNPVGCMKGNARSKRFLIVSPTGMGKSMYMRMSAICLSRRLRPADDKIEMQAARMSAPDDKYVIYLPAYMFSFCFRREEYQEWTQDLVMLYFRCMFELSGSINFDKQKMRNGIAEPDAEDVQDYAWDKKLESYMMTLAKEGKLILLADSFDEIVTGSMREAYLAALNRFCHTYGINGAHIIVTTRKMSSDTMQSLSDALQISLDSSEACKIPPFGEEQQRQLIANWSKVRDNQNGYMADMLDNRFFKELCSNPYILSFVCTRDGIKPKDTVSVLIDRILDNFIYRVRTEKALHPNDLMYEVLDNAERIRSVLSEIALQSICESQPHLSVDTIKEHFGNYYLSQMLPEQDLEGFYRVVFDLFITAVGLLVPAEGEDDKFQFISDLIRCELAAARMAGQSDKDRMETLDKIRDPEAYLALIVPLICKMSNNLPLSERIISHLALHDYTPDNSALFDRAMIDLLLARYGSSIIGKHSSYGGSFSDAYCDRVNRMLMLRLLTSPTFSPDESEREAIRNTVAYSLCKGFVRPELLAVLGEPGDHKSTGGNESCHFSMS